MYKIHGQWSQWSRWSKCDNHCGRGNITRERTCNNPTPKNGGRNCSTDVTGSVELRPCYRRRCDDENRENLNESEHKIG